MEPLHDWQVSVSRAMEIQRSLAERVSRRGEVEIVRFVGGVDISVDKISGTGTGAVVILRYPELTISETSVASSALGFPYIPGLLSFREAPLLLAACERLTILPDLILVDGQGVAHPRRIGLASHLGLLIDKATIGCAKTRLTGEFSEVGPQKGDNSELRREGEVIGAALRTRAGVKPMFISPGNRITLKESLEVVIACCLKYRIPEPVRQAHHLVNTLRQNIISE